MLTVDMSVDWGGRPLAELERLMEKRQRQTPSSPYSQRLSMTPKSVEYFASMNPSLLSGSGASVKCFQPPLLASGRMPAAYSNSQPTTAP